MLRPQALTGCVSVDRFAFIEKCGCAFMALLMGGLVLFGRGVLPVALGTAGILLAFEGFYGARMLARKRLLYFAGWLVLFAIVSLVVGYIILVTVNALCYGEANTARCQSAYISSGKVLLYGTTSYSAFLAILTFLLVSRIPAGEAAIDEMDK